MADHGMQAGQQFSRVRRQQAIGMPGINVERLVILTEAGAPLRQQEQTVGIVVHRKQLFREGGGLSRVSGLQVRLQ